MNFDQPHSFCWQEKSKGAHSPQVLPHGSASRVAGSFNFVTKGDGSQ
jgi:hypothetical protein